MILYRLADSSDEYADGEQVVQLLDVDTEALREAKYDLYEFDRSRKFHRDAHPEDGWPEDITGLDRPFVAFARQILAALE